MSLNIQVTRQRLCTFAGQMMYHHGKIVVTQQVLQRRVFVDVGKAKNIMYSAGVLSDAKVRVRQSLLNALEIYLYRD